MLISVLGGFLYQWDTGRKIRITDVGNATVSEVHFAAKNDSNALVVNLENQEGSICAKIPNVLLQDTEPIIAYVVVLNDDGRFTKYKKEVSITPRQKPDDYIYTQEEILTYKKLEDKLNEIELNGVSDEKISKAIEKYLDENEIESGVNEEQLNAAVSEALDQAKQSGLFDGAPGLDGKDGQDYVLTEDDKQEIASMAADKVEIPEAPSVELDITLKQQGKAADASAVGTAILNVEKKIEKKVEVSQLNDAIEEALTEAKNSGEFDGQPGAPGYTPQKGVDYFDGAPGPRGDPGVYIGTTPPTDPSVKVWINPDEESDYSSVVIDSTLKIPGQAADAAAVGSALSLLNEEIAAQKEANAKQDEAIGKKLDASVLPTAINTALEQAKASGEFDGAPGAPGAPGYTPQKGVDYFDGDPGAPGEPGKDYILTEADKQEIAEMAAEKIEVPESGGGSAGGTIWYGQGIPPEGYELGIYIESEGDA